MLSDKNIFTDEWEFGEIPFIEPFTQATLDLSRLVCMGSCFARNYLRWLSHHKIITHQMPWDILYNPFSILMEIKRVFEPINWRDYVIVGIDRKGNQVYLDPWRTWYRAKSLVELESFNKEFDRIAREYIENASSFLFTFGLTEIWSLRRNKNIILNRTPIEGLRAERMLWEPRFASVQETYKAINDIIRVLRKNLGMLPVVLTLSPVPLKYTASNLSVREANNLSKATLIISIYQVRKRKNVFYFPSYEIVRALSEQRRFPVWQEDGRHITAAAVDFIARLFMKTFNLPMLPEQVSADFWVPMVDAKGKIVGQIFTTGKKEIGNGEIIS